MYDNIMIQMHFSMESIAGHWRGIGASEEEDDEDRPHHSTKYMVADKDRGRASGVAAGVVFDGDAFEVVYPETLVTRDQDVSCEMKIRMDVSNRIYYENFQMKTKFL